MPSPDSSAGTPRRMPRRSVALGAPTGSGNASDVESHGSSPSIAPNSSAESVTSRVNGPA